MKKTSLDGCVIMVPINCYAKTQFDRCCAEFSLQLQRFDDFFQRELGVADNGVSRSVVYSDYVIFTQQPAAEDDVSEEALTFVVSLRFENRPVCSCDDLPRLRGVQHDRAETVTIVTVDAVVYFEPAKVGFERDGTGTDFRFVPVTRSRPHQTPMITPAAQIGRFSEPDILFFEQGGDRSVKGVKFAVDFFEEMKSFVDIRQVVTPKGETAT